ncbi:Hypothetical protein chromosome condensation (RCC1) and BTB (POZ) domain containing protein [Nesidiocoris tenuis]|uniref:BTB domain-containing protein n=1 Tax=Nesidiocoris tenuis TaxID=355587 RepID=A0ABN7AQI3_9HEMI|nr:Hypothetical protein chromosome condensation (RCC1) and BTB (POZ) domain containing protein [Nesidiocoris tenuis]
MSKEMFISSTDLGRWDLFKTLSLRDRLTLKAFCVFRNFNCTAAFLFNDDDEVFGISSDSCFDVTLLGLDQDEKSIVTPMNPFKIDRLSGLGLTYVSVGVTVGAALDSEGQMYWWGKTSSLLLQPATGSVEEQKNAARLPQLAVTNLHPAPKFKQVSCGHSLVAGLTDAGKVYVWGRLICSIFECEELVTNSPVDFLSCGGVHMAMLSDGKVYTWGVGFDGQRGPFSRSDLLIVKQVVLPGPCVSVVCGPVSTVMLLESGDVYVCGANNEELGFLGVDCSEPKLTKPMQLQLGGKITEIAVTWVPKKPYVAYAATDENGDTYFWGTEPVPAQRFTDGNDTHSIIEAFQNLATPRNIGLVHVDRPDSLDLSLASSIEILSQSCPSNLPSSFGRVYMEEMEECSNLSVENDMNTITEPTCPLTLAYELFGTPKLSDITFVFADSKFPGHRLFLCSRSKHFRETIDMNVPANENPEMDCKAYDAEAFKCFLEYLYRGSQGAAGLDQLLNLHAIAIEYDEPELVENTSDKIIDLLTPDKVCTVVAKARTIPSPILKKKCTSYVTYMSAVNPAIITELFMALASKPN